MHNKMFVIVKKIVKDEKFILFALLFLDLIFTLFYIFNYKVSFHSDAATANLLAREQMFEGRIFPENWVYAQDIWFLFINNFIYVIDSIFHNALFSRELSVLIQNIILAVVMWVFFEKMDARNGGLLFLVLLFSGISDLFLEMFFGQAAYGNVLLMIFLGLFLVFRVIGDTIKLRIVILSWIPLFLLSISMNITGLRYIFFFCIPLIISLIIYILIEYLSDAKISKEFKKYTYLFLLLFVALIIGHIFNSMIIKQTGFINGVAAIIFTSAENLVNNFNIYIIGFLQLFSAIPRQGSGLISVYGLFSLYRVLTLVAILIIIPLYLLFKYRTLRNKYMKIIVLFYIISFILTSYVYIFGSLPSSDLASSRYFLIIIFISLVLVGIFYDVFVQYKRVLTKFIFIICVIPLLCSSYLINLNNAYSFDKAKFEVIKKENRLEHVKNYLISKKLNFGFASYWNAGALTVLSNYSLEVPAIDINQMSPFYWLSSNRWYQNNYRVGESFLLLMDDEKNKIDRNKLESYLGKPIKDYIEENFEILVYNFNIGEKMPGFPIAIDSKIIIKGKDLPSQTGRVQGDSRIVEEDLDKPGYATFGPYTRLTKGKYMLTLNYKSVTRTDDETIANWDIGYTHNGSWKLLDQGALSSIANIEQHLVKEVYVDDNNASIEFRTQYLGKGDLVIYSVDIERAK